MESFVVKPVPGRIVLDPETLQPLAESGETKPRESYWQRRVLDGDVIVQDEAEEQVKAEENQIDGVDLA